jgi:hypothetical protein
MLDPSGRWVRRVPDRIVKRTRSMVVGTTVDGRTALDRAKDELTESLRECGDAITVAVVIRFIDQMRDITDRVLFCEYSAERFAFGRVATELDAAAIRAGLRLPEAPVVQPVPDQVPEDNLRLFG